MDVMRRRVTMTLGLGAGAALLSGCTLTTLNAINTLTPGDSGVVRIAQAAPYGSDPRQKLDVYAPSQVSATPAPVVVFFYGGSWNSGDRQGYAFVGQALAARGFVVVVPDYRLVPQVVFPGFVEDGASAVRWVRDNIGRYGGDPQRMALSGHSAGAYISAALALDEKWLRAVGVDPKTIRAFANLAGPYDFYPFDVQSSQAAFGSYPNPQQTQPINFARGDAPPAFLAYGEKDTTVKPRNSIRLAEALKQAGAVAELKSYPALDHISILLSLSKPFRGKAPVLEDMTAFLHAHLG